MTREHDKHRYVPKAILKNVSQLKKNFDVQYLQIYNDFTMFNDD